MKTPDDELGADKTIEPAAFVYKNIHFVGFSLYCDEFSADVRNSSEDLTSGDFSLVSGSYVGKSHNLIHCRHSDCSMSGLISISSGPNIASIRHSKVFLIDRICLRTFLHLALLLMINPRCNQKVL